MERPAPKHRVHTKQEDLDSSVHDPLITLYYFIYFGILLHSIFIRWISGLGSHATHGGGDRGSKGLEIIQLNRVQHGAPKTEFNRTVNGVCGVNQGYGWQPGRPPKKKKEAPRDNN